MRSSVLSILARALAAAAAPNALLAASPQAEQQTEDPLSEIVDMDSLPAESRLLPPLEQIATAAEQPVFAAFVQDASSAFSDPVALLAAADRALAKLGQPTRCGDISR